MKPVLEAAVTSETWVKLNQTKLYNRLEDSLEISDYAFRKSWSWNVRYKCLVPTYTVMS